MDSHQNSSSRFRFPDDDDGGNTTNVFIHPVLTLYHRVNSRILITCHVSVSLSVAKEKWTTDL